jgi:hypothetical protein
MSSPRDDLRQAKPILATLRALIRVRAISERIEAARERARIRCRKARARKRAKQSAIAGPAVFKGKSRKPWSARQLRARIAACEPAERARE